MDDGDYEDPQLFSRARPAPTEDDERYINAATTPFERLARKWERQSQRMGLDPNRPTPKDLGEERWVEFWGTWEKHERTKGMVK